MKTTGKRLHFTFLSLQLMKGGGSPQNINTDWFPDSLFLSLSLWQRFLYWMTTIMQLVWILTCFIIHFCIIMYTSGDYRDFLGAKRVTFWCPIVFLELSKNSFPGWHQTSKPQKCHSHLRSPQLLSGQKVPVEFQTSPWLAAVKNKKNVTENLKTARTIQSSSK